MSGLWPPMIEKTGAAIASRVAQRRPGRLIHDLGSQGIVEMTHFKFTIALESGGTVEYTPQQYRPLTLSDLYATITDTAAPLQICCAATDIGVDGSKVRSSGLVRSTMTFEETPRPFALLRGGWLPLPLVIPPNFLVDRNVISDLKKLQSDPARPDLAGFDLWKCFFSNSTALFNPMPYAWEGRKGRAPNLNEFVEEFESGATEIRRAVPGAGVVTFGRPQFEAALEIRSAFEADAHREESFLREICPLLADRVKPGTEIRVEAAIWSACRRHDIPRHAFAVIAALSCLYDDRHGIQYSIGRQLIKPSRDYSAAAAYNAVSDLAHMKLAIVSGALHGDRAFSLATSDRALAAFWCALRPVGRPDVNGDFDVESDLSLELFPRFSSIDELKRLEGALTE